MALKFSICEVRWERYRRVADNPHAREWLKFQAARGLAANTIEAYGRDLDSYLGFLASQSISFEAVIRPTIGAYIRSITGLAVPTVQKDRTVVRTALSHALTASCRFGCFMTSWWKRICAKKPAARDRRGEFRCYRRRGF
jgi:hypothetical protein